MVPEKGLARALGDIQQGFEAVVTLSGNYGCLRTDGTGWHSLTLSTKLLNTLVCSEAKLRENRSFLRVGCCSRIWTPSRGDKCGTDSSVSPEGTALSNYWLSGGETTTDCLPIGIISRVLIWSQPKSPTILRSLQAVRSAALRLRLDPPAGLASRCWVCPNPSDDLISFWMSSRCPDPSVCLRTTLGARRFEAAS